MSLLLAVWPDKKQNKIYRISVRREYVKEEGGSGKVIAETLYIGERALPPSPKRDESSYR